MYPHIYKQIHIHIQNNSFVFLVCTDLHKLKINLLVHITENSVFIQN